MTSLRRVPAAAGGIRSCSGGSAVADVRIRRLGKSPSRTLHPLISCASWVGLEPDRVHGTTRNRLGHRIPESGESISRLQRTGSPSFFGSSQVVESLRHLIRLPITWPYGGSAAKPLEDGHGFRGGPRTLTVIPGPRGVDESLVRT